MLKSIKVIKPCKKKNHSAFKPTKHRNVNELYAVSIQLTCLSIRLVIRKSPCYVLVIYLFIFGIQN